jgi:hypothetical protein
MTVKVSFTQLASLNGKMRLNARHLNVLATLNSWPATFATVSALNLNQYVKLVAHSEPAFQLKIPNHSALLTVPANVQLVLKRMSVVPTEENSILSGTLTQPPNAKNVNANSLTEKLKKYVNKSNHLQYLIALREKSPKTLLSNAAVSNVFVLTHALKKNVQRLSCLLAKLATHQVILKNSLTMPVMTKTVRATNMLAVVRKHVQKLVHALKIKFLWEPKKMLVVVVTFSLDAKTKLVLIKWKNTLLVKGSIATPMLRNVTQWSVKLSMAHQWLPTILKRGKIHVTLLKRLFQLVKTIMNLVTTLMDAAGTGNASHQHVMSAQKWKWSLVTLFTKNPRLYSLTTQKKTPNASATKNLVSVKTLVLSSTLVKLVVLQFMKLKIVVARSSRIAHALLPPLQLSLQLSQLKTFVPTMMVASEL